LLTASQVEVPIVQAMLPTDPKLETLWFEAVSSPVRRTLHIPSGKALFDFAIRSVEFFARRDFPALW
jgi:hypothetical protein